jgi:hypothetical protein
MGILSWCSRRVGGLSITALVFISGTVIYNEHQALKNGLVDVTRITWTGRLLTIFAYYSFIIHVTVAVFPIRACLAIWDLTRNLRRASQSQKWSEFGPERKLSTYSLSSSAATLTPSRASATSSDTEDFDSGYFADVEPESTPNLHAVLIPNYKEDIDVLRETLDVLASHPQARDQYDVSDYFAAYKFSIS